MDLNRIFLLIALLSPIALIVRSQRAAKLNRSLRVACFAVLVVTGVAWFLFPDYAGFIGSGAWLALLLIPALASHKLSEFAVRERFTAARHLANFLNVIRPAAAVRGQAKLFRALEIARSGDIPRALEMLHSLQSKTSAIALQATAQSFRLRGDWEGLLAWCRSFITPMALQRDEVLPLYFRALGETHRLGDLVAQVTARVQTLPVEATESLPFQVSLSSLWAFTGRKDQLVRLFEKSKIGEDRKTFWLATAELAAGNIDLARKQLERLRTETKDAILRSEIVARLQHADEYARAAANLPAESDRILRRLETLPIRKMPYFARTGHATPVVTALIIMNVGMFLLEVLVGGSTNPFVLHRLGQLETLNFFEGGHYSQLLTSLFLHYGPIHLLFNLYALYILGPALEASVGALRFIACYFISGIGSGFGVVLLHAIGLTPAQDVVGASGCIMGIVGAWAGFLLRYRHLAHARRRLQNIVFIVVIQTIFDISTPQISMAAHISGLMTGFIVGLVLAPRDLQP